jgi:NAD(P)-dependent dehydrogenase (short-subunit alcohol dehydrogenase family)
MSGKRTAIITGASGGIGAGLVEGFLRECFNVVATSRDANRKLTTSGSLVLLNGDIGEQQPEFLVDLKDLHRSWWGGITPDGSPIFSRDISTDEIYALDLDLP